MKKINKNSNSNTLTRYAIQYPTQTWESYKDENAGNDFRQLRQMIFNDQGNLCAYCESSVKNILEYKWRVEHFHAKSDVSNPMKNWALDWLNVFGVCIGGEDSVQVNHPLPNNLSCDAHKNHLFNSGKLPAACEGFYLNPLNVLANPCLFYFDKATGKLLPNEDSYIGWTPHNQYTSVAELVDKTIEILNLNCQRLMDNRLEVLKSYNREVAKYRKASDLQGFEKLTQRWFQQSWLSFFTTRRILLGDHAEEYLKQKSYNG